MSLRIEDLQLNGLRIFRRDDLPGYTTDSVLLADFVRTKPGDIIIDLGTGTGIIPLLLLGRQQNIKVIGLEIDKRLACLASQSIVLNKLAEKIEIVQGDIREISGLFSSACCNAVVCNPPYFSGPDGNISTHQHTCNEQDILIAARYLLLPGGNFYTCCPAKRFLVMADVMRLNKIEPKQIRLIASRIEKAPYLVLMQGKLYAKPGYIILPQLILLDGLNQYTDEMKRIYHMENEGNS